MNVTVDNSKLNNIKVGDIIQFGSGGHREHNFYMVCHSQLEGYFMLSLTGKKTQLRFYETMEDMLKRRNNIIEVFSQKDYVVKISKKNK
ncbi:hypothetical protein [Halalkalibacter oceani]|uniref:hypothetical protein n=1 Tax=Halalkalibacter oceani TaxID=1653776 RepID=UPI003391C935